MTLYVVRYHTTVPLSNAFKLKLGYNENLYLVDMKAATGKDIVEHIIKLAKVSPTSLVPVTYSPCYSVFISEGSDENNQVVDEEAVGKEIESINVSSD
jgi:Tfp pilus assembly PilM family ATPase